MRSQPLLVLIIVLSAWLCGRAGTMLAPKAAKVTPYFSPRGGCAQAVCREIGTAKTEVLVAAYSFTSDEIGLALVAARKRGVAVNVILDKQMSSGRGCEKARLSGSGCRVVLDGRHRIMHDKYLVIDRREVITGSYNFTASAETSNAENLVVIASRGIAEMYRADWVTHQAHATPASPTP